MEQDNGKYNSVEVAKYIAAYWNEKGADINMTKIQKILYIAYGTWLAIKDERLVDEHPQAWPYGPVFPSTRNALLKMDFNAICWDDIKEENLKNDIELKILIDSIFNSQFGEWTANELSAWSHKEGSPWEYTSSVSGAKWGNVIDDNRIKSFFRNKVINWKEWSKKTKQ